MESASAWTVTARSRMDIAPRPALAPALRVAIERRLGALVPAPEEGSEHLRRAMRHLLLSPGKRLRPLLVTMCTLQLGGDEADAVDIGCAFEMVHVASLILDDLPCMDDASVRRGRPTTHVVFGQDVAILAAIALLGKAFEVVSQHRRVAAPRRIEVTRLLAACIGTEGLSGGQFDDLHAHHASVDAAALERRNHAKTGALFVAAVESAAALCDVAADQRERLRHFATCLGIAFQICDDIHDATQTTKAAGKDTGKDAGKGSVALLGVHGARRAMQGHLAQAMRAARGCGCAEARETMGCDALVEFLHAAFGEEMQAMEAF